MGASDPLENLQMENDKLWPFKPQLGLWVGYLTPHRIYRYVESIDIPESGRYEMQQLLFRFGNEILAFSTSLEALETGEVLWRWVSQRGLWV